MGSPDGGRTSPEIAYRQLYAKGNIAFAYNDFVSVEKEPPREAVSVRLKPAGLAWVDAFAEEEDRKRSDMVRVLVEEAVRARIAKRPQPATPKASK